MRPIALSAALLLAAVIFSMSVCDAPAAAPSAPEAQLSAAAQLGRAMFYDKTLSGSGKMACASCHDPAHAYAAPNALAVQFGGPDGRRQGLRAVPSLTYREHTPPFVIGPDTHPDDDDHAAVAAAASAARGTDMRLAASKATASAAVQEMVPQGGMDWDGRAKTLPDQAGGPLLDPREMANADAAQLMAKLAAAPYAGQMRQLFGPGVFTTPSLALGEAYFALARFQSEDPSFHRYDSKFDHYLAGEAVLSAQEQRGLKWFDDPKKGNCASCHLDKPSKAGGFAPVFTDYQFEALAAPRNPAIPANRDPHYADMGLCGPLRQDMKGEQRYCGYFKTPSLRNVATRKVFFHNGVFHSLTEVLRFYVERETRPERWYPRAADGRLKLYDDLPAATQRNVDVADAPFDRHRGQSPALTESEIADVVAFLKTLDDGYRPPPSNPRR